MAKFYKLEDQRVSLFPMFNILTCALGVMIFILITITSISLGVGKSVIIVLEGDDSKKTHNKKPTYIEWDGYALILYPSKYTIEFSIDINKIDTYKKTYAYIDNKITSTPLESIINKIKSEADKEYIVLLIRPSGFYNFKNIKGYIENKGIDIGYEPIDQQLNLRMR